MTAGKKSLSPEAMHRSDPPSDRASEPLRPSQSFFLPSVLLSPFSSRPSFSVPFPSVRPSFLSPVRQSCGLFVRKMLQPLFVLIGLLPSIRRPVPPIRLSVQIYLIYVR